MKTYRGSVLLFSLLLIVIVISCKKDNINNPGNSNYKQVLYPSVTTTPVFPSGDNNVYTNGGNDNEFANGNQDTNFPDLSNAECLIGNWIVPSPACYQGYHLQLTFFANGTGNAKHMDEYLCCVNANKDFTWCLKGSGELQIAFNDGTTSKTLFYCPSDELRIKWNNTNLKVLVRG
jgi:hypothetical protein